jgi:hypothetical protein
MHRPRNHQVKKVKDYMKDPTFTYEGLRSISVAGAGLLKARRGGRGLNLPARQRAANARRACDPISNACCVVSAYLVADLATASMYSCVAVLPPEPQQLSVPPVCIHASVLV